MRCGNRPWTSARSSVIYLSAVAVEWRQSIRPFGILYTFWMTMQELPDTESIVTSVRDWVAAWGAEVAAVDMAGARHRFADDVVGFGTHAAVVHGLDDLESDQWRHVWPTI